MKSKGLSKLDTALQLAGMAVCTVLCLTDCTREEMYAPSSGQPGDGSLVFTVLPQAGWNKAPATRSSSTGKASEPIPVSGGREPYYLHVSSEEGISSSKGILPGEGAITKGSLYEQNNFWPNFSLFGYTYPNGDAFGENSVPDFCHNLKISKNGDGGNTYAPADGAWFLPAKGTDVTFFAMAPFSEDLLGVNGNFRNSTGTVPAEGTSGVPSFKYFVPWYSPNQQDLCFINGTEAEGGSSGNVELRFHHVLTAVRIVADASMPAGTVKQVRIRHTHYMGTFTPGLGSDKTPGKWVLTGDVGDTQKMHSGSGGDKTPEDLNIAIGGKEVVLCGDESSYKWQNRANTFFMLPQELTADNVLEIVYRPENADADVILQAVLGGNGEKWEMGTTVTYRLSSSSSDIDFDVEVRDPSTLTGIPYKGGEAVFDVTSRQGDEALPYVIEYAENESGPWTQVWTSETPDRLSSGEIVEQQTWTSTETGKYTQNLFFTGSPITIDGENYEKITSGKGSASDNRYDLSFDNGNDASGSRTTSNCYIVSKAGYYKFPAVCGAMLKNGKVAEVKGLGFMNGANIEMSQDDVSTYCMKNGYVRILWQDKPGLISNVYTQASTRPDDFVDICFDVNASSITTGNAVIGFFSAYNKNECVWSWHIWVSNTAEKNPVTLSSYTDNGSRNFLRQPIGWVAESSKQAVYSGRSGFLRFRPKDDEAGITPVSFKIVQESHTEQIASEGNYLMYQWGRKDPIASFYIKAGEAFINTNMYGPNSDYFPKGDRASLTMQTIHNKPTVLNTNISVPGNNQKLWNLAASTTGTTKSPYDPSPRKYKLPPRVSFEGLFKTKSNLTQFNGYSTEFRSTTYVNYVNTGTSAVTSPYLVQNSNWELPRMGVYFANTDGSFAPLGQGTITAVWSSNRHSKTVSADTRPKANNLLLQTTLSPFGGLTSTIDVYGEGGSSSSTNMTAGNLLNGLGIFCVQDP